METKASIVYYKIIKGVVVRDAYQVWPVQIVEQTKGKLMFREQDVDFVDGKCVIMQTSNQVRIAEYHKGSWIVTVPHKSGRGNTKIFGIEIEIGRSCFMANDEEIAGKNNAGKFFDL